MTSSTTRAFMAKKPFATASAFMAKTNQLFSTIARLRLLLVMLLTLTVSANAWGADFNTKYTYSMLGDSWSLTNCEDASSYWRVPKNTAEASIACFTGIFSNKTITSDVVITLDIATYGNGNNPSASKFSIYNSNACSTPVTATQGGTLPTSSTYTTATYTIAKNEAAEKFTTDLAIKVEKGTKQIRLRSISVKFSYENAAPAVKHKAYFYNSTTILNAGGTEFAEGEAVSYSGSTPTSCDGESVTFVGWATSTWNGKVAKGDIVPDFYNIIDAEDLPKMGTADVNYYAVFAKEATTSGGATTTTFTAGTDNIATGKNGIKFTMSNTTGSGGYYQVYSGSAMTITSDNPITSFIMTCTKSGTEKYGPGNITFKTGVYSYSGTNGTWTGNSNSIESNNSSAQLRITKIVVTTSGGTTTTYSDYITQCTTEPSVTLQPNGGTGTAKVLATTDGSLTLPECDFTYEGYRFVGWNTKAEGTGTTYQPSAKYTPTENPATLYAKWAKEYTVTYNANGGTTTCEDNNKYIAGEQVTVCTSAPTRDSYTFNGWSYSPNVAITDGQFAMPENDVTITAQWTSNKTTTSLSWSADTYSATIDAANDFPTLTIDPEAIKESVQYTSSDETIATIDANGNITLLKKGETTITATFEETAIHTGATDSYTLTVNPSNCRWIEVTDNTALEDDDEVVITMINGGSTYALPNDQGTSTPDGVPADGVINGSEIVANTLKWTVDKSEDNYIFHPNGDNSNWLYCIGSDNGVRVGTNENKTFTIDPTSGYLKHIATSRYLRIGFTNNTEPVWRCYTTTTAGQTLKFYKRECLDASKVWVEGNLTNVTCDTQLPQQLAKDGSITLTFTAADDYELPNTVTVDNATKTWNKATGTLTISNPTGNVEITISALQTYTINYDAGSGDGIKGSHDSQIKTHNIDIELADKCFTRPGYKQTGWSKTDGGQKDYDLLSQFGENANTTLYPYWTKVHTITWMADRSAHDEATYLDGETLALPETDPEACQGSVLVGWTDDEDYFNATTAPTYVTAGSAVKDDATYYAVYAEVTLGEPIKEEITNTYTFSNYTAGTQYATNEEHILDEDVTIYTTQCHFTTELRIYASNTHNGYVESNKLPGNIISIGFNAGENSDNLLVYGSENGSDWNQIGKVAVNSSYKDYTLDFGETDYTYFKLDVEGSSQIRIKSMFITYMRVSEEVSTDYINYSTSCIPTYHVNYELAGGENGCADEGVKVGNDYTICGDEPTKTGYTFQHWTDGTNTYEAGATIENVQSNITLTAVWEAKTYTITWMSNGEEYVTTTHTYDQPLHIADAPYNCYGAKTFMGWTETPSVNENGEGITYIEESTNPSEKKTYYAVFADVEGGSEVENTITLNKDAMGTSNGYSDDEFKVDGITFLRSNWGRQQSGQDYFLQGKSDNAFFNSDEIPGYIKSITINKYGGSGKFYIGTTQSPEDNETEVQNGTNTYTYSKANGYKYIKFLSTSPLKINSISIVCVIGGTEISNYTTTPAGCPEIEVAENAYVTSTSSQSVKVKVPVTISNYQDGISLSASIEGESNFTIANISSITEGTATLEIAYKPTDYNTTENTTVTILTKIGENKVTAADFTITGRSLPEKFAIVAEKDGKYYALPADMPSAGTYAGYEVEVKDNAIVTAPATYVYSLSAVHNTRYADYGTAVRFVGNNNKCLWASKEQDGTNIRNSSQVENAKYDQYEWNLSTTDGERYTISSSVVADAERILRLYNQKFGMYKDGVSAFYFLPLMASTEDAKVLSSAFSVSATEKVQFSAGNLQYHTGDQAWRFAPEQYDYVGDDNANIGEPTFEGWIDMFGWSADGKYGVNTSINNDDYQGEFVDWGTLFPDEWYTLSKNEWLYLLFSRTNATNLKQLAKVGDVYGVLLFPDEWVMPYDVATPSHDEFNRYSYSLEDWQNLEIAGAVFLPAAGRRSGADQVNTNHYTYYWTSTKETPDKVYYLINCHSLGNDQYKYALPELWHEKGLYGQSVRLARKLMPLQVVEWKENSVVVMYNGDPAQTATVTINNKQKGTAILSEVAKDIAVYELPATDLASSPNQPLEIAIGTAKVTMTIPYIATTTTTNVPNNSDLVILKDATFTATNEQLRNVTVYGGGELVVGEGATLSTNSLTLRIGGVTADGNYDYVYPQFLLKGTWSNTSGKINLDYLTTKEQYYTFVTPFAVNTKDIKYPVDIYGSNVAPDNTGSFEFQYYDGAARAEGNTGWTVVPEGDDGANLEAGQGYTFLGMPKKINGTRQKYGIHRIPMSVSAADAMSHEKTDQTISVAPHPSAKNNNSGWNLIGNPYMATIGGLTNEDIQVGELVHTNDANGNWTGGWHWDEQTVQENQRFLVFPSNDGQSFSSRQASNATLPAFKNFFVQIGNKDANALVIPYNKPTNVLAAPARRTEEVDQDIELAIVLEQDEAHSDQLDFLINNIYTEDFERDADFTKMMNATNLNLYGVHPYDNLSFVAIDNNTARGSVAIGYQVPQAGEYTLRMSDKPYIMWDKIEALYVTDHEMSPEIITDIMSEPYRFTVANAETNYTRFTVSVILKVEEDDGGGDVGTGVDNTTNNNTPCKFIYQDKMYILLNGVIYDAMGKQVQTINK